MKHTKLDSSIYKRKVIYSEEETAENK